MFAKALFARRGRMVVTRALSSRTSLHFLKLWPAHRPGGPPGDGKR
jgi:hypothetical protein